MDAEAWTSLEVAKLAVAALVPISVAVLGIWISQATKRLEASQWLNQRLVEKRIAFVDAVSPRLNDLYIYYRWIGDWRELSPVEVLNRKRELDREFNVNRPFLTSSCLHSYQAFTRTLFKTYAGPGLDAKLRTTVRSRHGDRSSAYPNTWQPDWDAMFVESEEEAGRTEVKARYDELVRELGHQIG